MLQSGERYHCWIHESSWRDRCMCHTGTPRDDWVFVPVTPKQPESQFKKIKKQKKNQSIKTLKTRSTTITINKLMSE